MTVLFYLPLYILLCINKKNLSMKKKKNFNDTHPELRRSEVFLTSINKEFNADADTLEVYFANRFSMYKTKRLGFVAYNEKGHVVQDFLPIFVNKKEHEKVLKEFKVWSKNHVKKLT
jgi:hypothetical protein